MAEIEAHESKLYGEFAPLYDKIFGKIFYNRLERVIEDLDIPPGAQVLEVGAGTGTSFPAYPTHCNVTGVDLAPDMLARARQKIVDNGWRHLQVIEMNALDLKFPDNSFDRVIATYVISAVPDPVKTLLEMRRVCKPSGHLVILNHFKSDNPVIGMFEKLLAPVCTKIGFNTELKLMPLLERVALAPEQLHRVNLMNGWRLVRCINP